VAGVVVLGGGAAGEAFVAALRRLDGGVPITLVERGLVGGECTYFACMPSKTLLRSTELAAAAARAPGAQAGAADAEALFAWRDVVVDGWRDGGHAEWLADRDVELVRGNARVVARGRVDVDGRTLEFDDLVVATGSEPVLPPVEGLDDGSVWTTREATAAKEVPERLAVVGGGAAGCELAQAFRRLGSEVVLVQSGDRLLPQLDADAAAVLEEALREDGIALRLEARLERLSAGPRLHLAGGDTLEAGRVLVATGRRPNAAGLGLETLGVRVGRTGIEVDERLRAAETVWAIGDVTGRALFTHLGKYQARIAAENVAGGDARADYRAVPAVVFTDPQVATVGRTEGDGLVSAIREIERTSRTSTYERPKRRGFVKLVADADRRVLVGAAAAGPEAGEWLGQLTLAVRAQVPVEVLRDTIQPFPTFSEAIFFAARELPL
jgi:pyruvate/2-oxoglutarate dehydrogenase complex dihydrolipoamide dehydrogenase (E3) component